MTSEAFKKILCIDFDGVIHWYRKGWQEGAIYDPPVPGAMKWLFSLLGDNRFTIAIYSSRSSIKTQRVKMRDWLFEEMLDYASHEKIGFHEAMFKEIQFPTKKPPAWLTIDDRAIQFKGQFPTLDDMNDYQPWNKDE